MVSWQNFSIEEFDCKHCGINLIDHELVDVIQEIRTAVNRPLRISSGYRCVDHPIEKRKRVPGEHAEGTCADVACAHRTAFFVLKAAMAHPKVTGIGVSQKGVNRYIHIGIGPGKPDRDRPRPHVWSY